MRILHVLGAMNRGGVETWLMHVLRNLGARGLEMDFVVHTRRAGAYDDEVRALGSRIIPCLTPRRSLTYMSRLRGILRDFGPYDVVHSHVHHFSGVVLRAAAAAGVPLRIAHSHNDTSSLQASAPLLRRAYLALMRRWIARYANVRLACSRLAARALFAEDGRDQRCRILHYGIDLGPFEREYLTAEVRREVGLPAGATVLGHVGRFDPQKNHAFVLEVALRAMRMDPRACLLLVGDGALRAEMEALAGRLGIRDRTFFAGVRPDVPRILIGAMDVFVFPSIHEGLPVAALEAQAAGLPAILSDSVTEEVEVVPRLVRRMSLDEPPEAWAGAVLSAARTPPPVTKPEALSVMAASAFNIENCLNALEDVYRGTGVRAPEAVAV